jgi:plastocyanin
MRIARRSVLVTGASALVTAMIIGRAVPAARDPDAVIRMRSDELGSRVIFDPIGLHVPAGAEVRWVCEAGVHTTTAYHPANGKRARRIPENAKPWDSGYMQPGDALSVTTL